MIDGRDAQVTRAFADNSLADGADVVDLRSELTIRCAEMLDVATAGAARRRDGDAPRGRDVLGAHPQPRAVLVAARGRPVQQLLPRRRSGQRARPQRGVRPIAALRPGRDRSGLRVGARPAAAAQRPTLSGRSGDRDDGRRAHRRGPRARAGTGARSGRRAHAGPARRSRRPLSRSSEAARQPITSRDGDGQLRVQACRRRSVVVRGRRSVSRCCAPATRSS